MDFGEALKALKKGAKIARAGWNGKGMYVTYSPAVDIPAEISGGVRRINPYMLIKNVDDSASTWVPSVNDCFADDWALV